MDAQRFEQEILKLAFETKARITAASAAYYLGIPSRDASRMLNTLLADGILELDSDPDGNLYYRVPQQDNVSLDFTRLEAAERGESSTRDEPTPKHAELGDTISDVEPPPIARAAMSLISPDDDAASERAEAFSPARHRPPEQSALRATDATARRSSPPSQAPSPGPARHSAPQPVTRQQEDPSDGSLGRVSGTGRHSKVVSYAESFEGVQRVQHPRPSATQRVFGDVTARTMEPDAWVGSCGTSPVVVAELARCEPRPLSEARPTIVSCADAEEEARRQRAQQESNARSAQHQDWWEYPTDDPSRQAPAGAMVLASRHANLPARPEDLEQPEHQPGMALLLSLILCGTGQIYNGEVSKGIMMMVLCFLLWFVLLGWVVHIWSIVDAVVVAERINRRKQALA